MKTRIVLLSVSLLASAVCASADSSKPILQGTDRIVPQAYKKVAGDIGVPSTILYAMALAESGKSISTGSFRPYPWTLVTRGDAKRFSSHEEAATELRALLKQRITNVDVGVMQTNMYWHGYRYSSPEQALEPWTNLKTGAEILLEQYKDKACKKDWWCAVGRYHSYRKDDGERYAQRVRVYHEALGGEQ